MNSNITKIHITKQLSSELLMNLIDNYPNLNTITCSKSLYDRISKKYLKALKELDIEVKIEYKWGKNQKYSKDEINKILNLLNKGESPKNISKLYDIPVERVYYFRSKYSDDPKKYHYNRKYNNETYQKIKELKEKGKKPKEISETLQIPLRTVYYNINKK